MRYYQQETDAAGRLLARDADGVYDLTAACAELERFPDLAGAAHATGVGIDAVAERHVDDAPTVDGVPGTLRPPVRPPEVWAAGVTYEISEAARETESRIDGLYVDVYDADRPELFLKATPSRTVGPGDTVGVRADSDWNVPEPELGVVLYRGEIVGYTVGNDVSSRAIEGENPLYLPQAKVYDRCCSLGPCVASPATVGDPHDLTLSMEIRRDGEQVYAESTSTDEMVRTCEELVDWLTRHNALPRTAVLLTGTALVPPEEFSLAPGDHVHAELGEIGELVNSVVEV